MEVIMPSSYALGKHYEAYIKKLVDSGRYASASEVVRAAMREFEVKEHFKPLTIEELRESLAKVRAENDYSEIEPLMEEMEAIVSAAEKRERRAA
jgi:antitoxin ParD1/3/4